MRACQCTFCRLHGAISTSDPKGAVRFSIRNEDAVSRYVFGLRTAEFLVCRACGVYLAAMMTRYSPSSVSASACKKTEPTSRPIDRVCSRRVPARSPLPARRWIRPRRRWSRACILLEPISVAILRAKCAFFSASSRSPVAVKSRRGWIAHRPQTTDLRERGLPRGRFPRSGGPAGNHPCPRKRWQSDRRRVLGFLATRHLKKPSRSASSSRVSSEQRPDDMETEPSRCSLERSGLSTARCQLSTRAGRRPCEP